MRSPVLLLVLVLMLALPFANASAFEYLGFKNNSVSSLIRSMPEKVVEAFEVYAVAAGSPVSFSSSYDPDHVHYHLDYELEAPHCWSAKTSTLGQWIQVSVERPKYWTGVVVQGRGDVLDQWVTSFKVAVTVNGKLWDNLAGGEVFQGSNDRNSKVLIKFKEPVYARVLRIYPQTWQGHMSMRFDAIYLDLNDVI
jgi:hypothetical protein